MDDLQVHDAMAAALVERGFISQEDVATSRIDLEARLNGLEPAEATATATSTSKQLGAPAGATAGADPAAQELAPEIDPLDAAIFAGAKSAGEYKFEPPPHGTAIDLNQEVAMRAALVQAGIPPEIGSHFGTLYNKAAAAPPTPTDRPRMEQEANTVLRKQWGADFGKNLSAVKAEVAKVGQAHPELIAALEVSGLGSNHLVISSLYNTFKSQGRIR